MEALVSILVGVMTASAVYLWLRARIFAVVLGLSLAGGMALAAAAEEAKSDQASQSDEDMSVGEATDNLVEDAERVGNKAEEIGSDIAEGVEDAFESDKKSEEDAAE